VRFFGKRQFLHIRYASRVCSAEVALRYGGPSLEVFTPALRELAGLLPGALESQKALGKRLDRAGLALALEAATSQIPRTEDELKAFSTRVREEARVAAARRSPWERLDVDWSKYHSRAKALLDDPFFWDEADDYAPHGNDTGSDLMAQFRVWRRKNERAPALQFLSRLLRDWGFEERVVALSKRPLAEWNKDDEMAAILLDEATIALAFAQIKMEAACDPESSDAALASIDRQLSAEVANHFGWKTPPERLRRLHQMRAVLLNVRVERR